jgi:predicted ATP-grasp superfamily ATP-dependent carboligase
MMPVTSWGSSSVVIKPVANVFVYEALCGGSGIGLDELLPCSLIGQGAAMLQALIDDFCQLPGCQVWSILDGRPGAELDLDTDRLARCLRVATTAEHDAAFMELVEQADAVLVLAPETGQLLLRLTRQVESATTLLLGPGSDWVAIAGDKLKLNHHLAAHGVPVPRCQALRPGVEVNGSRDLPFVIKPRWGAGADGLQLIMDPQTVPDLGGQQQVLESFQPGLPVSVSALLLKEGFQLLPAGLQTMDLESGSYHGGAIPLADPLERRATSLASLALDAMPVSRGFVGIDMVLGDDLTGNDDVVIEINPRVTTSYVGLRAATGVNLAKTILDNRFAAELPDIFSPVQFTASGEIKAMTNVAL